MAAGISETGTQLFVRLGGKPSLELLDPHFFPSPYFPRPGDAVELYGPSGCGKSEMLLHFISNCVLPKAWKGAELGGLGVGVVLVDADYQFSMLRLFHILERRVLGRMEERKTRGAACTTTNIDAESSIQTGMQHCVSCNQLQQRSERPRDNDAAGGQALKTATCHCQRESSEAKTEEANRKHARTSELKSRPGDASKCSKENLESDFEMPTSEQTEAFIKSCLSRFYLVQSGGSSDQLIVTLHSLESLIANRPDMGVLMLENIAAFYWTDRMNGGVASAQEANQRRVVSIIKRLIGEYQLVLFATKPALIQRNRRNNFWKDEDASTTRANIHHSDTAYEHHEFMSNAWNKLITHRFILRRHERVVHVQKQTSTQSYYTALRSLPSSDHPCRFYITEQGVVHQ